MVELYKSEVTLQAGLINELRTELATAREENKRLREKLKTCQMDTFIKAAEIAELHFIPGHMVCSPSFAKAGADKIRKAAEEVTQ
jgi:hypothetical protein